MYIQKLKYHIPQPLLHHYDGDDDGDVRDVCHPHDAGHGVHDESAHIFHLHHVHDVHALLYHLRLFLFL